MYEHGDRGGQTLCFDCCEDAVSLLDDDIIARCGRGGALSVKEKYDAILVR